MHQGYNAPMRMPIPEPVQHQTYNQPGSFGNGLRPSDTIASNFSSVLDNADVSELRELIDNEEKLHKLLDDNNEVKQLQAEREMQLAGNRSLADYNMKQGPTLSSGKQQLAYLYKQLNEQNTRFEQNKRNLEILSSQYKPDTIMALLQTSVAETEESSEKIADSFMDGNITVDDFLEKYLKERTSLHIRRTKVDKLRDLMRRR